MGYLGTTHVVPLMSGIFMAYVWNNSGRCWTVVVLMNGRTHFEMIKGNCIWVTALLIKVYLCLLV